MDFIKDKYYDFLNKIYSWKLSLKKVFTWIPIIWHDRDWDYHHLFIILHKKLEDMENFFNSDKTHTLCAKKRANEIKTARILCERLIDNDYLENALHWHNKKFEEREFEFAHDPKTGFSMLLPDPNKEREKDFMKCGEHSRYMENQDKDYLFDFMKKKIGGWWD